MPQLGENFSARSVDSGGDALPTFDLRGQVQAGHVGIALALLADGCTFGDEQPGASALAVVGGGEFAGDIVHCAVARQGGHGDAVGQGQFAELHRIEQRNSHGFTLGWRGKTLRPGWQGAGITSGWRCPGVDGSDDTA